MKISNKDFLAPLKNRPGLEPSIDFKNQLLRELQNVKPRKQKMKSFYVTFLASAAALLVFILFSSDFLKQPEVQESKGSRMLMKSLDQADTAGPATIQAESPNQTITSEKYHVAVSFPKEWRPIPGYDDKFGGEDGFVQLDAFNGENLSIDEAAKVAVEHHLKPFGTKPEITSLEIQGQEARLIMPSDDQPIDTFKMAEVIIKYVNPIVIDGRSYSYFIVDGDVDHIHEIVGSVQFLE